MLYLNSLDVGTLTSKGSILTTKIEIECSVLNTEENGLRVLLQYFPLKVSYSISYGICLKKIAYTQQIRRKYSCRWVNMEETREIK